MLPGAIVILFEISEGNSTLRLMPLLMESLGTIPGSLISDGLRGLASCFSGIPVGVF